MALKKSDSIKKMQELGLNTMDCLITKDFDQAQAFCKKHSDKILSMRTERGNEFLCPFYYGMKASELIIKAIDCLGKGYTLLLYQYLDFNDSLGMGTISVSPFGEITAEFAEGKGLLRDLYSHPGLKSITLPIGTISLIRPDQSSFYREVNEVIMEVRELCRDEPPYIVEWSWYKPLVGSLQKHPIYWEIRDYG